MEMLALSVHKRHSSYHSGNEQQFGISWKIPYNGRLLMASNHSRKMKLLFNPVCLFFAEISSFQEFHINISGIFFFSYLIYGKEDGVRFL